MNSTLRLITPKLNKIKVNKNIQNVTKGCVQEFTKIGVSSPSQSIVRGLQSFEKINFLKIFKLKTFLKLRKNQGFNIY